MAVKMTLEMAKERVEELEKHMSEVMYRLGMTMEESKKWGKKPEKAKKKRGMTGYLLYAKETRPTVKDELVANGNENPKPTEVITEVAKRWKSMSEDEQGKWNERAKTVTDDEE